MRDPRPALPAAGTGTAAHSGESPGSRDAAGFLGTQSRSEGSTRPRGSSRVPGDAALLLGLQPGSGDGARMDPGDTASLRGCSPVLREAVWLRGRRLCSKGRSRVLGDAVSIPGAAARALQGTALLSSAPELEREPGVMQP